MSRLYCWFLRLQLWWIDWDVQVLRHQQQGIEDDLREWQARRHQVELEILYARAGLRLSAPRRA